ncbi:MAG: sugar ABC transporter ATP-binding protein [Planctomycetota bacterium]
MRQEDRETPQIVLETRGIVKTFPGVCALDDVDFCVFSGQLNALVGENGAGKSTLMKTLAGVYKPDSGQILIDGKPVTLDNPRQAQAQGIAIIHQELNLIPYLSVAENIFLGSEFCNRLGLIDYQTMHRETAEILDTLDLHIDPRVSVSSLRIGQQQVVEIARALSTDARIIIMDEPTSALSEHETDVLFSLIENLKRQGVAVVYITHKLDELFRIGDRVSVLRDGQLVGKDWLEDLSHDDIVRMMVGRDLRALYQRRCSVTDDEAMRVDSLTLRNVDRPSEYLVDGVSFQVRRGEVLGVFGLMGSGRTELLETIFGRNSEHATGNVFVHGTKALIASPTDAIRAGIGLAPEDRKEQGLVMTMDVAENISLASLDKVQRMTFLRTTVERTMAEKYVDRLKIRTTSVRQNVETLSGGNQQKVILGKWLATEPTVLLLDEPTRGIDINAKRELYHLIDELTGQGLAIVLVSSELPEILGVCDRIMVMCEGRKTAEFSREQATEEAILKAALPKSA